MDTPTQIKKILGRYRKVAVVGLSDNPERDSYKVGQYLLENGFDVIPINPSKEQILGRKSYGSLLELPEPPEIVVIFRRKEAIPGIMQEAIEAGAKVVWMQLGLSHPGAAQAALSAGLEVVQDRCIMLEHKNLTESNTAKGKDLANDISISSY